MTTHLQYYTTHNWITYLVQNTSIHTTITNIYMKYDYYCFIYLLCHTTHKYYTHHQKHKMITSDQIIIYFLLLTYSTQLIIKFIKSVKLSSATTLLWISSFSALLLQNMKYQLSLNRIPYDIFIQSNNFLHSQSY